MTEQFHKQVHSCCDSMNKTMQAERQQNGREEENVNLIILIRTHVYPFSTFSFTPSHPEKGFSENSKWNIENIQYIVWIIFKILFHYLLHTVSNILPQFTKTNARLFLKDSNTLKMSILRTSAQISRRISDHLLIMLLFYLHKTQMFETQMLYIPTE